MQSRKVPFEKPDASSQAIDNSGILHLTDLVNVTELASLRQTTPSEPVDWVYTANPWSSNEKHEQTDRRTLASGSKLPRRYVDPVKCSNAGRRIIVRNELHANLQLLQDVPSNLTLSHPVWRTLVAAQFRDEPKALERTKIILNVLHDRIIAPGLKVAIGCDAGTPQCLQRREVPADGREQVPAGYYSDPDNEVNLCDGFFSMRQLEKMRCIEGAPMSEYESAGKASSFSDVRDALM